MRPTNHEKALGLAKMWGQDIGHGYFPKATESARHSAASLLEDFLGEDDYAAEKLVKSFFEPLYLTADHLMRKEGLPFEDIFQSLKSPILCDMERIKETVARVEEKLLSEIARQNRHFRTFLGSARCARAEVEA